MAHINRRFIDKHWLVFIVRGGLAGIFGFFTMFGGFTDLESVLAIISVFLLAMGIVDSVGALYSSTKKHGWVNAVIDALIDVAAALLLLFFAREDIIAGLIIIAGYTFISGIIDILHGFLSTVDPTDRFIRILCGMLGSIMGFVILNAGNFELTVFIRFFGAYLLIVGITSLIYGAHNRAQDIEDREARRDAKRVAAKKSTKAKTVKAKKSTRTTKKSK